MDGVASGQVHHTLHGHAAMRRMHNVLIRKIRHQDRYVVRALCRGEGCVQSCVHTGHNAANLASDDSLLQRSLTASYGSDRIPARLRNDLRSVVSRRCHLGASQVNELLVQSDWAARFDIALIPSFAQQSLVCVISARTHMHGQSRIICFHLFRINTPRRLYGRHNLGA